MAGARRPTRVCSPARASASRRSAQPDRESAPRRAGTTANAADADWLRSRILHEDDGAPGPEQAGGARGPGRHQDATASRWHARCPGRRRRAAAPRPPARSGHERAAGGRQDRGRRRQADRGLPPPSGPEAVLGPGGRPAADRGWPDRPAARQAGGRQTGGAGGGPAGRADGGRGRRPAGAHPLPDGRARRQDRELARPATPDRAHPSAARTLHPASARRSWAIANMAAPRPVRPAPPRG